MNSTNNGARNLRNTVVHASQGQGITVVQQAAPPVTISRENCFENTGIKPDDLLLICERLGVPVTRPMRGVVLVELAVLLEALRNNQSKLPRKSKQAEKVAAANDDFLAANGLKMVEK